MNLFDLPWVEIAVAAPLLGAVAVRFARTTETADRVAVGVTAVALLAGVLAWLALLTGATARVSLSVELLGRPLLVVDRLSGPLLPLVALLHLLTIAMSAKVKRNRMSFTGLLIGESIRLATFSCLEPWPLVALPVVGTVPPYLELRGRGKPTRVYLIHMALFVGLLVGGVAGLTAGGDWAPAMLMGAVLVRSGTVPAHLWVADLFQNATFGTALLFATPIAGVYAALRLVLPVAPEWVLQGIGLASQVTAVYAAGLAVVETDARRFFACLFLSHASLVLIGLELHTATSLSGALTLWVSTALALGGLGLVLRALEARHGRLTFTMYRGLYGQTPELAVGFLLMGLGCVGFPGTLGFVAVEVLVDGALNVSLTVGLVVVTTAALNGIAVIRAYLLLFTGHRHRWSIPMPVTGRERVAILVLSALILGGGLAPQYLLTDRREAADEVDPAFRRHPVLRKPVLE